MVGTGVTLMLFGSIAAFRADALETKRMYDNSIAPDVSNPNVGFDTNPNVTGVDNKQVPMYKSDPTKINYDIGQFVSKDIMSQDTGARLADDISKNMSEIKNIFSNLQFEDADENKK